MNKKIIPFLVATGLLLGSFGIAAAYTAFLSGQVGTSPTNGFVLQTNGSVSTWVATSSLGISGGSSASSTLLTDNNTFSGINSFTNALSNWAGTWAGHAVSYFQVAGNYLTADPFWVYANNGRQPSPVLITDFNRTAHLLYLVKWRRQRRTVLGLHRVLSSLSSVRLP
jgi:hypothetical protein